MTNKTDFDALLSALVEAQKDIDNKKTAVSREDYLKQAYAKVLEVNPDLSFADFIKELVEEESKNCGYMQRLDEALREGAAFEVSIFSDVKRVLDLASKSRYVLIPAEAWGHVISNMEYAQLFDPITQEDLALAGKLGTMLNCEFYTSAFASPEMLEARPESKQVLFVLHEEFRKYFNKETKRFMIEGDLTEDELARIEIEDQQALERCHFIQHLPHALEHGVLTHVDIFNGKHEKQLNQLLENSKYALIPSRAWCHIIGSNDFAAMLDPITDYNLALDGDLGVLNGCRLYTDGFLKPHLKDRSEEARTRVLFVPRDSE